MEGKELAATTVWSPDLGEKWSCRAARSKAVANQARPGERGSCMGMHRRLDSWCFAYDFVMEGCLQTCCHSLPHSSNSALIYSFASSLSGVEYPVPQPRGEARLAWQFWQYPVLSRQPNCTTRYCATIHHCSIIALNRRFNHSVCHHARWIFYSDVIHVTELV